MEMELPEWVFWILIGMMVFGSFFVSKLFLDGYRAEREQMLKREDAQDRERERSVRDDEGPGLMGGGPGTPASGN